MRCVWLVACIGWACAKDATEERDQGPTETPPDAEAPSDAADDVTTPDVTAPTWPTDSALGIVDLQPTSLTLSWPLADDNEGVHTYSIFQDAAPLISVEGSRTTVAVSELTPRTSYTFEIEALDAAKNASVRLRAKVETPDGTAPVWPADSVLNVSDVTGTSLTLTWPTTASDDVAVTGYLVLKDNVVVVTLDGDASSQEIDGLVSGFEYTFRIEAFDAAENVSSNGPSSTVRTLDIIPPEWPSGSELVSSNLSSGSLDLAWSAATDNVAVTVYNVYRGDTLLATVDVSTTAYHATGLLPLVDYTFSIEAGDAAENWSTDGPTRTATTTLPPSPELSAPPLDTTTVTSFVDATAFLCNGENPIQIDFSPDAFSPTRVAVLRGTVVDADGPLSAVRVSVVEHADVGYTLTRDDGAYDLTVNGGGNVTVRFEKAGYLTAERQIPVPWQDYVCLDDVILVLLDARATEVPLNASDSTVASSGEQEDTDGSRRVHIYFPPGTEGEMVFENADGIDTRETLTSITAHATEYTVGNNGPLAMPASLPPNSAYTFAFDLSVDEAISAGADRVEFNQPLSVYVDNFLEFPVGEVIPLGFYETGPCAAWKPAENGIVIRLVALDTDGHAVLDTDSDDTNGPADYDSLSINDDERLRLGDLVSNGQFSPGGSFWRFRFTHFSKPDCNAGYRLEDDARGWDPKASGQCAVNGAATSRGSIIENETQILGEAFPVAGTPFELVYRSDRVIGRRDAYRLEIPLTDDAPPASLQEIAVKVEVAGRVFSPPNFASAPGLSYTFEWDGIDAYGRALQGAQPIVVHVGYVYFGEYAAPARFGDNAARSLGIPLRQPITWWEKWNGFIGNVGDFEQLSPALGGFSISAHHVYDPRGRTLYEGDGTTRRARATQTNIAETAAGLLVTTDCGPFYAEGGNEGSRTCSSGSFFGSAAGAGDGLGTEHAVAPGNMAVTPDGTLWFINDWTPPMSGGTSYRKVRKLDTNGMLTTYVPDVSGYAVGGLDVAPDGSIFMASGMSAIFRMTIDDAGVTLIQLNEPYWYDFLGDGGPLTNAGFAVPGDVAVGPDCSLYIADTGNNRIRKVAPDGIIQTIVGGGSPSDGLGDGGLATDARIENPRAVAMSSDGNLYVIDRDRVRRVGPDGIIQTIAGGGSPIDGLGDGLPATEASISGASDVIVAPDGALYVASGGWNSTQVRHIDVTGIITTIAGNGSRGIAGDGGPATAAQLSPYIMRLALAPNGSLYVGEYGRIRRIRQVLPEFGMEDQYLPSEDGSEVFVFDARGRHLDTIDALTGVVRYEFSYDAAGRLASIVDTDGNTTTVTRDSSGKPTSIASQDGQVTTLAIGSDGYLEHIENPMGDSVSFEYAGGGLLARLTDMRGAEHIFDYDEQGRLIRDQNAVGGETTLERTIGEGDCSDCVTIDVTSPMGLASSYILESLPNLETMRTFIYPDNTALEALFHSDGSEQVTYPDGATESHGFSPEPRWGMLAPILGSSLLELPSGLTRTTTATRTVELTDPLNPFTLETQTDTVTINGRSFVRAYDAELRTLTTTTPMGRTRIQVLDAKGHVTREEMSGIEPIAYVYDERGRLTSVQQAARTTEIEYDPATGYVASITEPPSHIAGEADPRSRVILVEHDAFGRITERTRADGLVEQFTYDAAGNLDSVTPPTRPTHALVHNAFNELESYTPPDLGADPGISSFTYDLEGRLVSFTRPDETEVVYAYDDGGHLATVTSTPPGLQITNTFSSTTGQLESIATPVTTITYLYDGPLTVGATWSGQVSGSVARTYDANLQPLTETINDDSVALFVYDDDGLLTQAGDLALSRDPTNGRVTGTTVGNIVDVFTYNAYGELAGRSTSVVGETAPFYAASYERDADGRVMTTIETIGSETRTVAYAYDLAGRLASVTEGDVVTTVAYDANGNRVSGSYDVRDRFLANDAWTLTYTANDEVESRTPADGGPPTSYAYDALGRLVGVSLPDRQIDYVVDGWGRRVGKKIDDVLVQSFLYSGPLAPLAEFDSSGTMVKRFIYATHANVPDLMLRDDITYRIVHDPLGSPRLIVNTETGSITARIDYDAWGQVLPGADSDFLPFGFAGGLYDSDTGLVHFGAREYDPTLGRWLSRDPLLFDAGDTNLYSYVRNDPMNAIDSDGQCPLIAVPLVIGAGEALAAAAPYIAAAAGVALAAGMGKTLGESNPPSDWGYDSPTGLTLSDKVKGIIAGLGGKSGAGGGGSQTPPSGDKGGGNKGDKGGSDKGGKDNTPKPKRTPPPSRTGPHKPPLW